MQTLYLVAFLDRVPQVPCWLGTEDDHGLPVLAQRGGELGLKQRRLAVPAPINGPVYGL